MRHSAILEQRMFDICRMSYSVDRARERIFGVHRMNI